MNSLKMLLLTITSLALASNLLRQETCPSSEQTCDLTFCIPTAALCCSFGDGTFCAGGEYCTPQGCCEVGDVCTSSKARSSLDMKTTSMLEITATSTAGAVETGKQGVDAPGKDEEASAGVLRPGVLGLMGLLPLLL